MNTSRLKNFAQQSRNILMDGVARRLQYWGMDMNSQVLEEPQAVYGGIIHHGQIYNDPSLKRKWDKLKSAVKQKGASHMVEEGAYTWFNRIMAIRILSKCGYDEPQVEYASENLRIPVIMQRARRGELDFLTEEEKKRIKPILQDYDRETEAFALLLAAWCHHHPLLNRVFGRLDDYTELLIPENILKENGFIHYLNTNDAISDEDFQKVELIGWLYQFYISEKKDEVYEGFKNNKKAGPEEIPAATQIFTPNWIVKYMVENTVGRIWLNHKPESPLRNKMKYLVESEYSQNVWLDNSQVDLEDEVISERPFINEVSELKLLDPACGSGHILVEGFDLLFDIYMEEYYSPKDAIENILKNNLFGLDIDLRAVQLARFALLLKAAVKYPALLRTELVPRIHAMPDLVIFDKQEISDFLGIDGTNYSEKLHEALDLMQDSQTLGSLIVFDFPEGMREFLVKRLEEFKQKPYKTTTETALLPKIQPFIEVIDLLTRKYESVATNPPYMGAGNFNADLKNYVSKYYKNSKSDLFAVFMELCLNESRPGGKMGMINQQSWMFLSSYEKLREQLLENYCFESMLHLGPRTFDEISGEVVQSTAFVLRNETASRKHQPATGFYHRLIDYKNSIEKEKRFLEKTNIHQSIRQSNFSKIPGSPIAYWVSDRVVEIFESGKFLYDIAVSGGRCKTHNDEQYVRYIWEIDQNELHKKWKLYNKGGEARKWFGNLEFLINWSEEAKNNYSKYGGLSNKEFWDKNGITWSGISSGRSSYRLKIKHSEYSSASPTIIEENDGLRCYILGFLNTNISDSMMKVINPTMQINVGDALKLPIIINREIEIVKIVEDLINISKNDWDSKEKSLDFKTNPLLDKNSNLKDAYGAWYYNVENNFFKLHTNEEKLNHIFNEIYGLQDEIIPDIPLIDITLLQDELANNILESLEQDFRKNGKGTITLPIKKIEVMSQLISYGIGCMMGRYRLDKSGLHIAHTNPEPSEIAPYSVSSPLYANPSKSEIRNLKFEIDDDALIPLMSSRGYFSDDALHRFKQFLVIVWGEETLTENLNFLQECLGLSLDDYLMKHFWKDHCRRYKKRPIYWLFSSKTGAFQLLAYMHRMNRFTAQKVREKYLFKHIRYLKEEIENLRKRDSFLDKTEARKLEQMIKDLHECEEYNLVLKDIADQQIEFDLDDGVKVNYTKFGEVLREIK